MAELKVVKLDQISIPDVRVNSILNEEQRALMASTIKEIGLVQDIVVRSIAVDRYELIAGKSRLLELQNQGHTEVQVKVIDADSKLGLVMNIVENVARGSYDYISVSKAIRRLKELGASPTELEKIFPWRKRWIDFLEGLQDLPEDVVDAVQTRKITPTHVQLALNLPTPAEVHQGLRTAYTHEWDTGTFKIFVENRVEQISRARRIAESEGVTPVIPAAVPQQLISYKQCLVCGYQKPAEEITLQTICKDCIKLTQYITDQLGPPEDAMNEIYNALRAYHGTLRAEKRDATKPEGPPSQG